MPIWHDETDRQALFCQMKLGGFSIRSHCDAMGLRSCFLILLCFVKETEGIHQRRGTGNIIHRTDIGVAGGKSFGHFRLTRGAAKAEDGFAGQ